MLNLKCSFVLPFIVKKECSLTCDGEITWAVGLSSVILSKAGVKALIIFGGIEYLQTPVKQDGNAKNEELNKLSHLKHYPTSKHRYFVRSMTHADRELLKSSSLPFVQVNRGLGAALGLHSITTRALLAPRSCFLTGLSSKVGAQAGGRLWFSICKDI